MDILSKYRELFETKLALNKHIQNHNLFGAQTSMVIDSMLETMLVMIEDATRNNTGTQIYDTRADMIADNIVLSNHLKGIIATEGGNLYVKFKGSSKWTVSGYNVYKHDDLWEVGDFDIMPGTQINVIDSDNRLHVMNWLP